MQVILKSTVRDLGKSGDIKNVPDGYAQNFLIPKGLAVRATPELVAKTIQSKEAEKKDKLINEKKIHDIIHTVHGKKISFIRTHDHHGKLYQGISLHEIIQEIRKQFSILVSSDMFHNYKPIKEIGDHEIIISKSGKQAVIHIHVHS